MGSISKLLSFFKVDWKWGGLGGIQGCRNNGSCNNKQQFSGAERG